MEIGAVTQSKKGIVCHEARDKSADITGGTKGCADFYLAAAKRKGKLSGY
ncbi:hypothetical protein [Brenneria corticis]|nr:hypothetical protein [Brenneria sp. CFCC 11842]